MDDVQTKLAQLKQAYDNGTLDKDTYQTFVAALIEKAATPTAVGE